MTVSRGTSYRGESDATAPLYFPNSELSYVLTPCRMLPKDWVDVCARDLLHNICERRPCPKF